jgi:3-isopropylmalate dehydrogenase
MSKQINLAVIAGDGIGPEVVAQGIRVLDKVAAKYDTTFAKTEYDLGAGYWHRTGEVLPDSVMAEIAKSNSSKRSSRARTFAQTSLCIRSLH